jgi:uncharacterized DUF497 family protein
MRFDWDETKNAINLRKHGVSFDTASLVFDDPHQLLTPNYEVDGEERWQTIGLLGGVLILLVVHTFESEEEEEVIRIISARKAEPHERRQYEEGF